MSAARPNVILINCDDLGYGDLGCYGSELNATPRLDALAAEGLRLDSFYMGSPVCSPSRAAMMTGCYPPRIGFGQFEGYSVLMPGMGLGLDPSEITLATMLREAGYRTQMVGKWHCGDQPEFLPTRHGFEHYLGLPFSNDMGRQGQPTDRQLPPLPLMADDAVIEQQPEQASLTARYVNEAVRFLRAEDDRPFFLYFAHLYVHLPIYVQERFARESANGSYGAAVASIDWAAAVLLDELDRLGLAEDTIVIFTSDNGSRGQDGGSNLPLRGAKGSTWEGGQRVPCIVRWPGRITAGRVSDELTTAMDLYPTLATCCGASVPTDRTIDGRDISAVWFDESAPSPHEAFYYFMMDDLEAVRDRHYKLHFSKLTYPMERHPTRALYDLLADPSETTDIYAEHPDVVARLEAVAAAARASLGDGTTGTVGTDVRPVGRVANPQPLTVYDPDYPYYLAEYDLTERG